jgi:hypothetical protein
MVLHLGKSDVLAATLQWKKRPRWKFRYIENAKHYDWMEGQLRSFLTPKLNGYLPQPAVLIDNGALCIPVATETLKTRKISGPCWKFSLAWSSTPKSGHFAGNIKCSLKLQVSAEVKWRVPWRVPCRALINMLVIFGGLSWPVRTCNTKLFKQCSVLRSYMTCLFNYFRLFSHIYLLTVEGTVRRRRRRKQLLDNLKESDRTLHSDRWNIASHSVENLLWKRLWACRETDSGMITMIMMHNPLSSTLQLGYV